MIVRTARISRLVAATALVAPILFARSAAADVPLMEKDGWEVFMNGRIQTFGNYNEGQGRPANSSTWTGMDATGNMNIELRGGGVETGEGALPVYQNGATATLNDQGLVREMRIRSGFTGNVLGFGIRKKLSEQTEFLGYTAVTVGIDSVARRKFNLVNPDWRESFVRVSSTWGSLAVFSCNAASCTSTPGAIAPPRNSPLSLQQLTVTAVPASTTTHAFCICS